MNIRSRRQGRIEGLFSWGPDFAGDNYHDQENAQFSYFPMGKIKKKKQSLQRRDLVNGSESLAVIEMEL